MITEFEKGQWSVIQNVITFMKDDQTAMELCREAGFGKKKILELEKDSCTFMNEVKAFLKRQGHLFLTSSLKKYLFYNLLINNILYLCVT